MFRDMVARGIMSRGTMSRDIVLWGTVPWGIMPYEKILKKLGFGFWILKKMGINTHSLLIYVYNFLIYVHNPFS